MRIRFLSDCLRSVRFDRMSRARDRTFSLEKSCCFGSEIPNAFRCSAVRSLALIVPGISPPFLLVIFNITLFSRTRKMHAHVIGL